MESASGIGSNSDSFYEYLLKNYLLFDSNDEYYKLHSLHTHSHSFTHGSEGSGEGHTSGSDSSSGTGSSGANNTLGSHTVINNHINAYESYLMFIDTYTSIKRHVQENDWFGDVDMYTATQRRNRVESLHGYWPGMESSLGLVESSANILNSLYGVWIELGFLPEEFDQVSV